MPFFGISPLPAVLGTVGLVALCMMHDLRTRGRIHRVYWIGGLVVIGSLPARFWLMQSDLSLWITQPLARRVA